MQAHKPPPTLIWVDDLTFSWVDEVKSAMTSQQLPGQTVWLIAENCVQSGVIGMVNCLRKEPGGEKIRYSTRVSENDVQRLPVLHRFSFLF